MKKLLFTALAVVVFSTTNAQDTTFGAKAGLNLSTLDITDENIDSRTAFHLGVTAEIAISEKFSIQPELLYSSQGAKNEDSYEDFYVSGTTNTTWKIDYILLPVMAKFYVSEGLSLEAGPQIGFLASANADTDVTVRDNAAEVSVSNSSSTDVKDELKSIDFAFNLGLGYKLDNGLNFAARYNIGLSDINDSESDAKFKSRVFQLSVGFNF